MKILYSHRSAGKTYGGALVDLLRVLERLNRQSFEPIVLLSHGDFHTGLFDRIGIKTIHLHLPPWRKGKSLPRIPFAIYRLISLLKHEDIDLVHLNDADDIATVGIACKWVGIPCVVHARSEMEPRKFKKLWVHRADQVIAVSEAVRQAAVLGGISLERIRVIHSGIELSFFSEVTEALRIRNQYGFEDRVVIGTVANLSPIKGPDLFLEAMSLVCRERPEVVGLWVGADDHRIQEGLEHRAKELGIGGRLVFTGFQLDVWPYLSAMDLFVLPSLEEGFGLVLLEAMSLAKPVVATCTAGAAEIVDDGKTGLLVSLADTEALAEAIMLLVKNTPQRKAMGEAGRQRVKENFSLERQIHEWESVYSLLLRSGAKGTNKIVEGSYPE